MAALRKLELKKSQLKQQQEAPPFYDVRTLQQPQTVSLSISETSTMAPPPSTALRITPTASVRLPTGVNSDPTAMFVNGQFTGTLTQEMKRCVLMFD